MKRLVLMVIVVFSICAYFLPQVYEAAKRSRVASTPRPARTTTSARATTSAGAPAGASASGTPECCTFAPDAALPAPAAVSSGPEEERAILLARQVLVGGAGTLPALVAALQQAGFPIRDATGKIVVQPVGKSQGIAFDAWEVNALAELLANRRQVTVPLDNFAAVLGSALPEFRGAPMADLLLDGVRARARDQAGSLLFWAAFIAELGRQNPVHQPYDLLFDIDPVKTQLDVLQIALLSKRLAADLAVLAHPEKVGKKQAFHLPFPSWPASTVYAAELPCKFQGTEAEILDWVAVVAGINAGQILGYLEEIEVPAAEIASKIVSFANFVSAYAKLTFAMTAFDIKFEMQAGTPLVRTQELRPVTGEKKTIVATLKMDMGKIQWSNCFRQVLNAVGLDFNVENDGPIEGASVSWSGESGFGGQLVQFVGNAGSHFQTSGNMTSPILDARTDKSGKARVDVEGVGQRQDLGGDPKPVMKEATVVAMAVLKPANLYRDFKDAISTALGGPAGLLVMPPELLYRTNLSFGGSYTFPVKDWKPGNDAWTGVITDTMVTRQILAKSVGSKCCGGRPISSTQSDLKLETVQQRWEINLDSNAKAITSEFAAATASYSVNAGVTSKSMFRRTGWNSCKSGREATWSKRTVTEEASASLNGKAEVGINIGADGRYSIATGGPSEVAQGERKTTGTLEYGPGCGVTTPSRTSQKTSSYSPPLPAPWIQGKIDPNNDDQISGTKTEVEKDSRVGIVTTHTYTWNLTR